MGDHHTTRRGRPPLPPDSRRVKLDIRVPAAMRDNIDAHLKEGESRTDLVQKAVENEIKRRRRQRRTPPAT